MSQESNWAFSCLCTVDPVVSKASWFGCVASISERRLKYLTYLLNSFSRAFFFCADSVWKKRVASHRARLFVKKMTEPQFAAGPLVRRCSRCELGLLLGHVWVESAQLRTKTRQVKTERDCTGFLNGMNF